MKKLFVSRTVTTKALLLCITLALGLAPGCAHAQFWSDPISVTNVVPATATNSSPGTAVIDVSRVSQAALQINFKLQGAGTSAVRFDVQRSADGSNYAAAFSISGTANGTNLVPVMTNITVGAFPFYRISEIGNPNATAVTNLAAIFGVKRNVD